MNDFTPRVAASDRAPSGLRIGHVHLKTADLERIERFYVDVMGFDVIAQMPGAVFLSAGGYHHHLAFNAWTTAHASEAPSARTTGLYHIALNYPTRYELARALRRLLDAGHRLEGSSDHGTHEALYLSDPDGNGLELAWDRPREHWPINGEGHLQMILAPLNVADLLAETTPQA